MSLTRIVVLVNLKPGVSRAAYEQWARTTDLPTVNGLRSVRCFDVFEATGLLGDAGKPPVDYIEVLDIGDMALFGEEVSTAAMKSIAAQFQDWSDPVFITTQRLDWESA
jgi:hypothetical protein